MTDYASRIASSSGDAAALLALAIEMAQEVARLESAATTLRAAEEARKAGQVRRTRAHRNGVSRDVTLPTVTERDVTEGSPSSPPPQVSLLSPTPPNNPSFPPTPPTPPLSGGASKAATARLDPDDPRFAELWAMYPRRGGGNSRGDAFRAWSARLADGVDPAVMRAGLVRYVAYVRAKGIAGTEYVMQGKRFFGPSAQWLEPWDPPTQAPAVRAGGAASNDDAIWSALQDVVAKLARNQLTADEYRALPQPMQAGLRAIGGWSALREARPSDLPFRRRDFLAAYRAADSTVTAGAA